MVFLSCPGAPCRSRPLRLGPRGSKGPRGEPTADRSRGPGRLDRSRAGRARHWRRRHRPPEAEIIWDDAPGETAQRAGRDHVRGRSPNAGAGPGEESEAFWENDLNRAAAGPTREQADRRREASQPRKKPACPPGRQTAAGGQNSKARRRRENRSRGRSRKPRPLTLVLILVPLLVVTAFAWRYHRSLRKEYPLIAEKGRLEGIPALDEGDFDQGLPALVGREIGRRVARRCRRGAEEIRTAADEAAIFVDRCPRLLEDMLDEAGRTDKATWESKFDTLYKGRAIVIDSIIKDEPASGANSRYYLLEYVILPPGGATNFTEGKDARPDKFGLIDLEGFGLFELAPPRKGEHVTFGAQLATFKFDTTNSVWWIGLEPKSGVFITHTRALESLGFPGTASRNAPWSPNDETSCLGRPDRLPLRAAEARLGPDSHRSGRRRARRPCRRDNLVGRQVMIDDHVKYYVARTGTEPDEFN